MRLAIDEGESLVSSEPHYGVRVGSEKKKRALARHSRTGEIRSALLPLPVRRGLLAVGRRIHEKGDILLFQKVECPLFDFGAGIACEF